MIRILLVDDHPALRAGLHTVLRAEPGLVPVGAAASAREALPELDRLDPDVVVVDYHLPDETGLLLSRRIKAREQPPRVLIYSAYADAALAIPAIIAGADGVANKGAPAEELYDAIRLVARGKSVLPPVTREQLEAATSKLEPEELPVFGMLMDRTPPGEIAGVLGVDDGTVAGRAKSIIEKLSVDVPTR